MKKKGILNYFRSILTVVSTIFGNPLYQILSYLLCQQYNFSTSLGTNVTQIDKPSYFLFLVLIFIIRFAIYSSIFHFQGKIKPFNNLKKFFMAFAHSHFYQFLGLITLWTWLIELEGNIVGFFVAPISLFLGLIVAIVTFRQIIKIPKKWRALNI